jgi:hypothetical protein
MTIPMIPEMEALKIAEVTFPFAIETITTDEETGRQTCQKKYGKPRHKKFGIFYKTIKQKDEQRKNNKCSRLNQKMQFPVGNIFDDFFDIQL